MGKYDDIINLPHHVSQYHKPMPMTNRAAQFAPFAALSGHDEAIAETMRLTESQKELSDDEISRLSRKLNIAIDRNLPVEITYFSPDKTKVGGYYKSVGGIIKKWDKFGNILIMKDSTIIPVGFISEIDIKDSNIDF